MANGKDCKCHPRQHLNIKHEYFSIQRQLISIIVSLYSRNPFHHTNMFYSNFCSSPIFVDKKNINVQMARMDSPFDIVSVQHTNSRRDHSTGINSSWSKRRLACLTAGHRAAASSPSDWSGRAPCSHSPRWRSSWAGQSGPCRSSRSPGAGWPATPTCWCRRGPSRCTWTAGAPADCGCCSGRSFSLLEETKLNWSWDPEKSKVVIILVCVSHHDESSWWVMMILLEMVIGLHFYSTSLI